MDPRTTAARLHLLPLVSTPDLLLWPLHRHRAGTQREGRLRRVHVVAGAEQRHHHPVAIPLHLPLRSTNPQPPPAPHRRHLDQRTNPRTRRILNPRRGHAGTRPLHSPTEARPAPQARFRVARHRPTRSLQARRMDPRLRHHLKPGLPLHDQGRCRHRRPARALRRDGHPDSGFASPQLRFHAVHAAARRYRHLHRHRALQPHERLSHRRR